MLFAGLLAAGPAAASDDTLPILMYQEHMAAVITVDQHRCDSMRHYPGGNQILNEWLLLCQALRLGGVTDTIEFLPIPAQQRGLRELAKGHALMAGFTFWSRDHDPQQFWSSQATVDDGEFKKALYTNPVNHRLLASLPLDQLMEHTVLVNTNWPVDNDALSCFKNRYLTSTTYPNMLEMVGQGKIELMLHNLAHTGDFSHTTLGVRLEALPGYLVSLPDSLHYLVSRQYPGAKHYAEAIDRGLDILRQQGHLRQAYRSAAFFDDRVSGWQVIRCQ